MLPGTTRRRKRTSSTPPNNGSLPGEQRDRAGLRQRFQLEHSGEHRVAREVPGEERLVAAHVIPTGNRHAGLARVDGVDESERRPVRQQRDEGV